MKHLLFFILLLSPTFIFSQITNINTNARFDMDGRCFVFTKGNTVSDSLYISRNYLPNITGFCNSGDYTILYCRLGFLDRNSFWDLLIIDWKQMEETAKVPFTRTSKFFLDDIRALNSIGDTVRLTSITCFVTD